MIFKRSKIALSFSDSWYDVTDGLAPVKQLTLIMSSLHALLSKTAVVNCRFPGLSSRTDVKSCRW